MMKQKIIGAIALLTTLFSFGQKDDININWGELYKTRPNQSMGEIFAYDQSGYYTYQSSPNIFSSDPFVEKYDQNFNKVASALWTAKKSSDKTIRRRNIEAFLKVDDKVVAISSYFDRKNVQRKLYWETLNSGTMQTNDDAKPFATYNMEAKSIFNRANVYWTKSQKQTKYAFYSEIPRKRKLSGEQMYVVKVVDNDLNELWQHTIRLPYSSSLFKIKEIVVDDNGTFYLLGFNRFSPGKAWGSYRLVTIQQDGTVDDSEVNLPSSRYITSIHMEEDQNGDVICMGFYSDKIKGYQANLFGGYNVNTMYQNKGVFRGKFKDGDVTEMKDYTFPQEYLVKDFDKNSNRRDRLRKAFGAGSGEAQSFVIRDLIFDESDGSSYMLAEQYVYRKVTTYTANGGTSTTHYYYYMDMMVVKYDKNGDVLWMRKQPKGQMTTNDNGYYSSFTARLHDGNIYILYNDNIKNYTGKKKDIMTYGSGFKRKTGLSGLFDIKSNPFMEALRKDMCVSVLKFDKDGNMTKDMLFTAKENGAILVPKVTNNDLDKWIIYSKRNQKERIGEVQFK